MISAVRNYVHFLNAVPWMYGPQNKISSPKLKIALEEGSLVVGVICGALAKLFAWELTQRGHSARVVGLKGKGREKHLVHAVVEVRVGSVWELHDPYFNCSFTSKGRVLSAKGVQCVLKRGVRPKVQFDGNGSNWLNAWRPWQKSLTWIAEAILAANDYVFMTGERVFWELTLGGWMQNGSPFNPYGWKKRQYTYWEYF